jgi:hypothetical protein
MEAGALRPKPIFDTNVFGHVQDGSIPESDWRFLIRHRPQHGWPLSTATVLELLVGLYKVSPERFSEAKEQIELAYNLSKGRVLEDPNFLLCKEVLCVSFPAKLGRLDPELLADYIHVAHCAKSLDEIRERRVPVRSLLTKGDGHRGFAGFDASVIKELVDGPKKEWIERTETFLDEVNPRWRESFQETGKRLPDDLRRKFESPRTWIAEKMKYGETKLRWLEASATPESVADITKRLDAVMEFIIFVTRQVLLGNYNLEKHESDVYDQFQLHYLAMDRFIVVSEDSDLSNRTASSSQASRIQSFAAFLGTL